MSAPSFDYKAFDERLVSLGIYSAELAQIIGRDAAAIERWREGRGHPDDDELVRLRWLDDDADARRRVEALRRSFTQTLEGDGARYAGITGVPYGTADIDKVTGGVS